LRFFLLVLDLAYVAHCSYGVYFYLDNRQTLIDTKSPLLYTILPLFSSLGLLMLCRTFATTFFFLIVPYSSMRLQRSIFMKLGGGLYANAKFPMMKYRDYVLQLQRFDLLALNEFDEEDHRKAICQICSKVTGMKDDIVVLPCNFQHFFHKACI